MISLVTKVHGAAKASAKLASWRHKLPGAIDKASKQQALRLRTMMVKGIKSQEPGGEEFEPLADSTIDMKGSSKALIDNGDLIRSIGLEDVGSDGWFVGVNRTAENEEGMQLENLAEIHEFGTEPYEIPITPKMRGFFFALNTKGVFDNPISPDKMFIEHPGVPARPFLQPTFDEFTENAEDLFAKSVKRQIGIR